MLKKLTKNRNSRLLLIPKEFLEWLSIDDTVDVVMELSDSGPRLVMRPPPKRKRAKTVVKRSGSKAHGELTVGEIRQDKRETKAAEVKASNRPKDPECPVVVFYRQFCVPAGMPNIKLRKDGKPQSEAIRVAIMQAKKRSKDMVWYEYMKRASESPFLCGKVTGFRATLVWLIKPMNIAKVECGQYDSRIAPPNSTVSTSSFLDSDFDAI